MNKKILFLTLLSFSINSSANDYSYEYDQYGELDWAPFINFLESTADPSKQLNDSFLNIASGLTAGVLTHLAKTSRLGGMPQDIDNFLSFTSNDPYGFVKIRKDSLKNAYTDKLNSLGNVDNNGFFNFKGLVKQQAVNLLIEVTSDVVGDFVQNEYGAYGNAAQGASWLAMKMAWNVADAYGDKKLNSILAKNLRFAYNQTDLLFQVGGKVYDEAIPAQDAALAAVKSKLLSEIINITSPSDIEGSEGYNAFKYFGASSVEKPLYLSKIKAEADAVLSQYTSENLFDRLSDFNFEFITVSRAEVAQSILDDFKNGLGERLDERQSYIFVLKQDALKEGSPDSIERANRLSHFYGFDALQTNEIIWASGVKNKQEFNISQNYKITTTLPKTLSDGGVISNAGIITQYDDSVIHFDSNDLRSSDLKRGVFINHIGGIYDVQGDGGLANGVHTRYNPNSNRDDALVGEGRGIFYNDGTFRKSAGSGTTLVDRGISFINTGRVEVNSGTLDIRAHSADGASYIVNQGLLKVNGSSKDSQYLVNNDSRIQISGLISGNNTVNGQGKMEVSLSNSETATLSGTVDELLINGGLSTVYGTVLTLNMTGVKGATLDGGYIGAQGEIVNNGKFNWLSGRITNAGRGYNPGNRYFGALLNNSDSFIISGLGSKTVNERGVLTNTGIITQKDNSQVMFNSTSYDYFYFNSDGISNLPALVGTVNNEFGGLYDIQGDGGLFNGIDRFHKGRYNRDSVSTYSGQGKGIFNNAGTFRKSSGSGVTIVDSGIIFNNSGLVEVNTGTLDIRNNNGIGGSYTVNQGVLTVNGKSTDSLYTAKSDALIQLSGSISGNNIFNGQGVIETANLSSSGVSNTISGNIKELLIKGRLKANSGGELTLGIDESGVIKLDGGSIGAYGKIINESTFEWNSGTIEGSIAGGFINKSLLSINGDKNKAISYSGGLVNKGIMNQRGNSTVMFDSFVDASPSYIGSITNEVGGLYDIQGDGGLKNGTRYYSHYGNVRTQQGNGQGIFNNKGFLRKTSGTGVSLIDSKINVNNTGEIEVNSGTLKIAGDLVTSGLVEITENAILDKSGVYRQSGGSTRVDGELSASQVVIDSGYLSGLGTIGANVDVFGTIAPGASPGILTIDGSFNLYAAAVLELEVSGYTPGEYDQLIVSGNANFEENSIFNISFYDDTAIKQGDIFNFISASSFTGDLDKVIYSVLWAGRSFEYNMDYKNGFLAMEILQPATVPVPSAFWLFLGGLGILVGRRKQG